MSNLKERAAFIAGAKKYADCFNDPGSLLNTREIEQWAKEAYPDLTGDIISGATTDYVEQLASQVYKAYNETKWLAASNFSKKYWIRVTEIFIKLSGLDNKPSRLTRLSDEDVDHFVEIYVKGTEDGALPYEAGITAVLSNLNQEVIDQYKSTLNQVQMPSEDIEQIAEKAYEEIVIPGVSWNDVNRIGQLKWIKMIRNIQSPLKQPEPMSAGKLEEILSQHEMPVRLIDQAISRIQALGQPVKEVQAMDRDKVSLLVAMYIGTGASAVELVNNILALGVEQPDSYEAGEEVEILNHGEWIKAKYSHLSTAHCVDVNEYWTANRPSHEIRKSQPPQPPQLTAFEEYMANQLPSISKDSEEWLDYMETFAAGQQSKDES